MQLGTRWAVGGQTPAALPDPVVKAIRGVEDELGDTDTSQWRWTLTWLESKPVVELDDGTIIRYSGGEAFVIDASAAEDSVD